MSSILYYSNFCEISKKLLTLLSKSSVKKNIHFICIDKRIKKNNNTYIILENNEEIILPNNVSSVPALLLLNDNYKVLLNKIFQNKVKNEYNVQFVEMNSGSEEWGIGHSMVRLTRHDWLRLAKAMM